MIVGITGGIIFAPSAGWILQTTDNYHIVFAIANVVYLLAWLSLKIFVRRIEPLDMITHEK
jgi:fucose permease